MSSPAMRKLQSTICFAAKPNNRVAGFDSQQPSTCVPRPVELANRFGEISDVLDGAQYQYGHSSMPIAAVRSVRRGKKGVEPRNCATAAAIDRNGPRSFALTDYYAG